MAAFARRVWQSLGRRPGIYLGLATGAELVAALLISHGHRLDVAFLQFNLGAQEILATHHIQSTFLPIGYSALFGYLELVGTHLDHTGGATVFFAAQLGIVLGILLCSRAILRRYTSARFATTAALLVALEPALLYNTNRVTDANLTLALMLGFLVCLLRLRRERSFGNAALCGLALGLAVLVRPNLLLLALLLLAVVPRERPPRVAGLLLVAGSVAVLLYAGITALVHGRPFLPQNGPYNLYAGFNPETGKSLLTRMNGEASIAPAMADLGMQATLDWRRPSDVPGVDDVRDEHYIPFYRQQTRLFLRQHPGESAWLSVVKLLTFMRPIGENVDSSSGAFHRLRSAIKTVTVLAVAIWLGLLVYSGVKHLGLGNPLMIWTAVLYTLPFVLINADPRFRTALEGLVCVDLARMLYALRRQRQGSIVRA